MVAASPNSSRKDYPVCQDLAGVFREHAIRALVIDDNLVNIKLLTQQLNYLGCKVDSSSSGATGIELWELHNYSVIFLDCHMPNMNGKEVMRRIQSSSKFGHIKPDIIAFSADVSSLTRSDYLCLGASYFISKPIALDGLYEVLKQCLVKPLDRSTGSDTGIPAGKQYPALSEGVVMNEAIPGVQVVNINYLNNILGHDPYIQQTQRHLADMFLQQAPVILADMEVANTEKNLKKIGQLAHKFKSSARSVGAEKVAAACFSLEALLQKQGGADLSVTIGQLKTLIDEVREYWGAA